MAPASLVFLLALLLLFFNLDFAISMEVSKTNDNQQLPLTTACVDCTICPDTCNQLSPPSSSGYPIYGAPPPPSQGSGYATYGPPPPPPKKAKSNCPPVPVQCCGTITAPPGIITAPPGTTPPNNYTYLPNHSHSALPGYTTIPLFSTVILLLSFTALF